MAGGVHRIKVRNVSWSGIEPVNNAWNTTYTDLDIDMSGARQSHGVGVYMEHYSRNLVFERFTLTGVKVGFNGEWADPSWGGSAAMHNVTIRNGTIDSSGSTLAGNQAGIYLELADRYVGAPMLSALLGVYAARLGRRRQALELFERGYAAFILQPFTITAEYDPRVFPEQEIAGPFTANLGGFLMCCLYGLTGLQLGLGSPQTWCARPVRMPAGWEGIEAERIWVRGRPASLLARHGDQRAALEFSD